MEILQDLFWASAYLFLACLFLSAGIALLALVAAWAFDLVRGA